MNRFLKTLSFVLFLSAVSCSSPKKEITKTTAKIQYDISFNNAVHHEAKINIHVQSAHKKVVFRMSVASPGRYAYHQFAKNVYGVKATNTKGETLSVVKKNPYEWEVENTDGNIHLSYILFANRGGGTYAQVDETHAHLNMPATFMYVYVKEQEENPIQITFHPRKDLNWKVATQLKNEGENTFSAPNLQYFMDSPTEISNYQERSFKVDGKTIHFVLHHNGTEAELEQYFEKVKKVVMAEKEVYGELPNYDYNEYRFLACYIPNASGDGMEHRNSTILTSTRSLANGGMQRNIGTVAHEFFHSWNVERIRPKTLEPFRFDDVNMSGSLWFAEGFTSYYTNLSLCRATIITPKEYISRLHRAFNYVWNSPARTYFNPIEMSQQAPFVDAATSIDPVNRENMFISYYSYGSVLGLALDLSLRKEGKNLDDFMKLLWINFGKTEKPYAIKDLHNTLNTYAGKDFGNAFFSNYVYKSKMPNYKELFAFMGVSLVQNLDKPFFGARTNNGKITSNPFKGSTAYKANLEKGDVILAINGQSISTNNSFAKIISESKPNEVLKIAVKRFDKEFTTKITLGKNPAYTISLDEKTTSDKIKNRENWLKER